LNERRMAELEATAAAALGSSGPGTTEKTEENA